MKNEKEKIHDLDGTKDIFLFVAVLISIILIGSFFLGISPSLELLQKGNMLADFFKN